MKQNKSITKTISSGRKSRSLAAWQMLHRVVAVLALAFVSVGAWAEDYVFMYSDHYLTSSISYGDTFIPNTCIWTCDNSSLGTTSRALHSYGSTNTYLRGISTNGGSPSTGDSQANWCVYRDVL